MIRKIKKQRVLDWIDEVRWYNSPRTKVSDIKYHFGVYPILNFIAKFRSYNLVFILCVEQWISFKHRSYRHLTTLEIRNGLTLRKKSYRPY